VCSVFLKALSSNCIHPEVSALPYPLLSLLGATTSLWQQMEMQQQTYCAIIIWPRRCSKSVWTLCWGTWFSEKHWWRANGWTGWSCWSLPTLVILWFYDSSLKLPSSFGSGMVFENMMVPVELRKGTFRLKCLIFAPRVKHHLDSRVA